MKLNSSIYLISIYPQFNRDLSPKFESFSSDYSLQLYSSLIFNHIEILNSVMKSHHIVYCFDERDKDFLPDKFNESQTDVIFGDTTNRTQILRTLSEKYFGQSGKNLLIFSNSIGMSSADIQRIFNLLSIDDEAVVIGKAKNNKAAFIGFNAFNQELFSDIDWNNCNYDYLLARVNKHENFVHVLDNFMSINNLEDFKNLYLELSKKESLTYCSPNMHEKFTNLFIEYKELLK